MRVGLIADIHGNKLALDAVLEQLDRRQIDRILCLGDVAVLGPDPAGVIRTLRERQIASVMGNTDAWLFETDRSNRQFTTLAHWTLDQLTKDDIDFVRTFPDTLKVSLSGDLTLLGCPGSPRSYDDVLSAVTPETALLEAVAGHPQAVIAGGHTHIQLLRRFGQRHLVNPGSVGLPGIGPGTIDLPVNRRVDWTEYAILDASEAGNLSDSFYRLPIDLHRLFAAAESSGMPHLDWWKTFWAAA